MVRPERLRVQLAEAESRHGIDRWRSRQQKLAPGASLQILAGIPIPCSPSFHPGNPLLMRNPSGTASLPGKLSP
jgi:hypothetical protein